MVQANQTLVKLPQKCLFSTETPQQQDKGGEMIMDDLELQALNIQKSIDQAKQNMKEKTKYGLSLSQDIAK